MARPFFLFLRQRPPHTTLLGSWFQLQAPTASRLDWSLPQLVVTSVPSSPPWRSAAPVCGLSGCFFPPENPPPLQAQRLGFPSGLTLEPPLPPPHPSIVHFAAGICWRSPPNTHLSRFRASISCFPYPIAISPRTLFSFCFKFMSSGLRPLCIW